MTITSLTDWVKSDLPVTLKAEQQVNCNVDQLVKNDDDELFCGNYGSVQDADILPDSTSFVCKSPLTYVQLCVENNGPYKCLSDSGTKMPIAKRSIEQ